MLTIGRPDKMGGDPYKYYNELDRKDDLVIEGKKQSVTQGQAAKVIEDKGLLSPSLHKRDISEDTFKSLTKGLDPRDQRHLLRSAQIKADAGKEVKHRAGWDLQFAPDKSVSVVWGLSDDKTRAKIFAAHTQAVDKAMQHVEQNLAFTKVGRGGAEDHRLAGLLWTRFDHSTSRDLDPQLHSHNFVYNIGLRQDGVIAAVNSEFFFDNQKLIDGVYQAEFARGFEKMGFAIDHNDFGGFKVKGVPTHIAEQFSKRHHSIKEAIEKYGYRTPGGFARAAERTRGAKVVVPANTLHKVWQEQGHKMGFGQTQVMDILRQQRGQFKARSISKEMSAVLNKNGAKHSFKDKGLSLKPATGKSPLESIRRTGNLEKSGAGKKLLLSMAKDNSDAIKQLARGATSLAKMALPGGAGQLIAKAASLSRKANKLKGRRSMSRPTPERSRTKERDKEQERER